MARQITVIEGQERRGGIKDGDVLRLVTQYWTLDGELLAEVDNHAPQYDSCFGEFVVHAKHCKYRIEEK